MTQDDPRGLTSLEALAVAIRSEMDSRDVYRDLADRCSEMLLAQRFELLATEEERHLEYLTERYEAIAGGTPLRVPTSQLPKGMATCEERRGSSLAQILDLAVEEERRSREFYLMAAQGTDDPSGQAMFRFLADMEYQHWMALSQERDLLLRYPNYGKPGPTPWRTERTFAPGRQVMIVKPATTNGAHFRPGELSAREGALRAAFLAEVERIPGGDRLRRCIQCGTCSGSCPVSYAMDVQPRQIVAYFRAGDLESILRSRTIWLCASCYACTVRCPSGIKVTDLIYGLKRMAVEDRTRSGGLPIPELSRAFVRMIRRTGRNQELQLVGAYYLRRAPLRLFAMIPLGWRMLLTRRLPWRTTSVRDIEGLRRIIAKAEEIEHAYPRDDRESMGTVGYGVVTERPLSPAVMGGGA